VPRDCQAVAAVIALAADNGNALAPQWAEPLGQDFDDAQGGVLH